MKTRMLDLFHASPFVFATMVAHNFVYTFAAGLFGFTAALLLPEAWAAWFTVPSIGAQIVGIGLLLSIFPLGMVWVIGGIVQAVQVDFRHPMAGLVAALLVLAAPLGLPVYWLAMGRAKVVAPAMPDEVPQPTLA